MQLLQGRNRARMKPSKHLNMWKYSTVLTLCFVFLPVIQLFMSVCSACYSRNLSIFQDL